MRTPHILKVSKRNERVYRAIWFDTETRLDRVARDTIEHWLNFGWGCYRELNRHGNWSTPEWYRFETIAEFWNWVEKHSKNKSKLWLFCHNSNFDLPVLDTFRTLPKREWTLKTAIIDGPPTILQYRKDTSLLTIIDTLNFWRVPLAEIGQHVGLPKLDMPTMDAPREQWDAYGRRDVEIIMEACIAWWEWLVTYDMGGFAPTLAAQSMRTFRHKYMADDILIDCNERALEIARESYHGGRCECFWIGKQNGEFYLLDVNSMYPWVMRTYPMPIKLACVVQHSTVADLYTWIEQYSLIARCKINVNEPIVPVVINNKLCFPTGRFDACITTPEILWILEHGAIERVGEVVLYDQAYAFTDFVTDLYNCRLEAEKHGDTAQSHFFKMLLNSFYGKWAQRGMNWEKIADTKDLATERWVEICYETQEVTAYRQFGGIIQQKSTHGESTNSHPAIASHITAYARMTLWLMIERAGPENVLYVDTDSLLVTHVGLERLTDLIKLADLGALKVEGVYNHVEIYGCKDYVFGTKTKIKGIRKKAALIAPGVYEQERWSSLRGMLRDASLNRPTTRMVRKYLRRQYDKGTVLESGRIVPLHYF